MSKFFDSFFERKNNENDLSDVVYALISSDSIFAEKFLSFFDVKGPLIKIEREKMIGKDNRNRIDFKIETHTTILYLENKIDDKDYHFKRYSNAIEVQPLSGKSIKRAVISVHTLPEKALLTSKKYDWKVYYWNNFLTTIIDCNDFDGISREFENYLKLICNMKEVQIMSFDNNTKSIISFINAIENIIKEHHYNLGEVKFDQEEINIGVYYGFQIKDKLIGAWYGMLLSDDSPSVAITIGISNDYGRDQKWLIDIVKDPSILKKFSTTKESHTIGRIKYLDGHEELQFLLNDFPKEFNELDENEQKKILVDFFEYSNDILKEIVEYKKGRCHDPIHGITP